MTGNSAKEDPIQQEKVERFHRLYDEELGCVRSLSYINHYKHKTTFDIKLFNYLTPATVYFKEP